MSINVYPEPSSSNVSEGGIVQASIYGIEGILNNYAIFEGSTTLPSGFYSYRINTGTGTSAVGIGENYSNATTAGTGLIAATTSGKFKMRVPTFWEATTGPITSTGVIQTIEYANEYLFISGSRTFSGGATTGAIFISTNNTAWTEINPPATMAYNVIYDGTRYIAGHRSDGIIVSTDLVNWTTATFTSGSAAGIGRYEPTSSFFKYVFAGQTMMIVSTNGTTWTSRASNLGANVMGLNVRYLNNNWFTFANTGKISVSTNGGNNWNVLSTSNFPSGDIITDMAYGNNKYVAVSLYGNILWSTNGFDWTTSNYSYKTNITAGNQIMSVNFTGDYFFTGPAVNEAPYISTDGANWSAIPTSAVTAGSSAVVTAALTVPSTSVNFPNQKYYLIYAITSNANYGPVDNYRLDGFISGAAHRRRWSKTLNGRTRTNAESYLEKVSDISSLTATTT